MTRNRIINSFKIISLFLILSVNPVSFLYAQAAQDSMRADEGYRQNNWNDFPADDAADILDLMPGYQLFDFLDYGQPRYVAPLNMLPHQLSVFRGNWLQNDRLSGMYNMRLLSIDMIDHAGRANNSLYGPGLLFDDIRTTSSEPFSRLRYWEGDFGAFDLSLSLSERLSPRTDLYLAGFNRGYDGFWANSAYTGVKYDGRLVFYLDNRQTFIFSYGLNRQKNGMQNISRYSDYNRTNLYDFGGIEYSVQQDSSNRFSAGLHIDQVLRTVRSDADSFNLDHRYKQARFYLRKKLTGNKQSWEMRFQINQLFVNGTAYQGNPAVNRFMMDVNNVQNWTPDRSLVGNVSIIQENRERLRYNFFVQLNQFYNRKRKKIQTGLSYQQRLPDMTEHYFNAYGFNGRQNIRPESVFDVFAGYHQRIGPAAFWQSRAGYKQTHDEIILQNNQFTNASDRSWGYVQSSGSWMFWKMRFRLLGHLILSKPFLGPRSSLRFALSYHDVWLNGAMGVDLSAMARLNGESQKIFYNPLLERFYYTDEMRASFVQYRFKAVITVDDARLYFMMENPFIINYHIIEGYKAYARRVRFGVNWDFWN